MGEIYVRARVSVGSATARPLRMEVDGGAKTSVIGLNIACRLTPNLIERAEEVRRVTAGGAVLVGLQLPPMSVTAGRYKATLTDVFVPIAEEIVLKRKNPKTGRTEKKTARRPVDRNEPPLLGQDFLQATGAFLNYTTHRLEGVHDALYQPTATLSRKFKQRPATKQDRELIRTLAWCAVPSRKKGAPPTRGFAGARTKRNRGRRSPNRSQGSIQ